MPALTPSDAVILGLIAKNSTSSRPDGTSPIPSREGLIERLTDPAKPLGNALIHSQDTGTLPDPSDAKLLKAVEFLRRWGGHQTAPTPVIDSMFEPTRRVFYKGFVFEEEDQGYRLVGTPNHVYSPHHIIEYFPEPEANSSKLGLSEDELVRARQTAAEIVRSGEKMEDLVDLLTVQNKM